MRLVRLTTHGQLPLWRTQTDTIAVALGCHRELTTRLGVFPAPGTASAFVLESRFLQAWLVLSETVSGGVWAYMRVLGLSRIPVFRSAEGGRVWQPGPVDGYYFAKEAGARLDGAGGPREGVTREEVRRMVEELRAGTAEGYPSGQHFLEGRRWLKGYLDGLIRAGDRQVCESLYERKPGFAPLWEGGGYEGPWELKGKPLPVDAGPEGLAPPRASGQGHDVVDVDLSSVAEYSGEDVEDASDDEGSSDDGVDDMDLFEDAVGDLPQDEEPLQDSPESDGDDDEAGFEEDVCKQEES
ncbi:hypothetical protein QBC39DRAFT_430358 [Podospora conica]|nr:hypothetical protein QBC39DRAFT_430358 [Schizothecium conicum]